MDHFEAELTSYIHGVLAMHMPLHDDPNLRFSQAEQIASLIAAKLDHLKRHGSLTVDRTEYPIVTLSQQEYVSLKSELREWQARCRELSSAALENVSNRGRLQSAESWIKAQRVQVSALQKEIEELKAENRRLGRERSDLENGMTTMKISRR